MRSHRFDHRRRFLHGLAASPLLAYAELRAAKMQCGVQTVKGFTPEFVRRV